MDGFFARKPRHIYPLSVIQWPTSGYEPSLTLKSTVIHTTAESVLIRVKVSFRSELPKC